MKIHFLTFASSTFKKSLMRIESEAANTSFFDTISCIKPTDLPLSYRVKNIFRLNRFTRGYGYWMWKSYITKVLLDAIEPGDMIFYADAGCTINKEGIKRFNEYIEMLKESQYCNLSFQMYWMEKQYCKGDLFKYFNKENDDSIKNSGMLVGGVYLIQKNNQAMDLVNEWYFICHNKRNLIDDSDSLYPNDPDFIEHRHDQSVFSLLRKKYGSLTITDETFFDDWNANKQFPVHARRLRH